MVGGLFAFGWSVRRVADRITEVTDSISTQANFSYYSGTLELSQILFYNMYY